MLQNTYGIAVSDLSSSPLQTARPPKTPSEAPESVGRDLLALPGRRQAARRGEQREERDPGECRRRAGQRTVDRQEEVRAR